jgi:hypothetical protein
MGQRELTKIHCTRSFVRNFDPGMPIRVSRKMYVVVAIDYENGHLYVRRSFWQTVKDFFWES